MKKEIVKFNFNSDKEFEEFTSSPLCKDVLFDRSVWIDEDLYFVFTGVWMPETFADSAEFWIKK